MKIEFLNQPRELSEVKQMLLEMHASEAAVASGPLITSISDICGVIIYFTIASYLIG